jgi:hypothetical protein
MRSCSKHFSEIIELSLSDDLSQSEKQQLQSHLEQCEDCRNYQASLYKDDQLLDSMSGSLELRMRTLEKDLVGQFQEKAIADKSILSSRPLNILLRYAALVIVGITIIFALTFLDQPKSDFNSWDSVSAKVQQAKTASAVMTVYLGDQKQTEFIYHFNKDYGLTATYIDGGKMLTSFIFSMEKEKAVIFLHEQKLYVEIEFDITDFPAEIADMDFRNGIVKLLGMPHTNLENRLISGRLASGIRIEDEKLYAGAFDSGWAELWVDIETGLPVEQTVSGVSANGTIVQTVKMDNFNWNNQIDLELFSFSIPDGYTEGPEFPVFALSEEGALEGLRSFAELSGGKYPSHLNANTAKYELGQERDLQTLSSVEIGSLAKIFASGFFYKKTIDDDRLFEYYGGSVLAADTDRVLMRWQDAQGNIKVAYGDLRVEIESR